jgi:hypothetical protein
MAAITSFVQAEVILKGGIHLRKHADIGAGGEEFVACPGQQDHVGIVIHARLQNGVIELAIHLIGVRIGRRIVQGQNGNAAIHAILHQCFCFRRCSSCCCHEASLED